MIGRKRPFGWDGASRAIHFAALLFLAALIEWIRSSQSGVGALAGFASLPGAVYGWVPVVAGVSVMIPRADRADVRVGLGVALFATLLMVLLDFVGHAVSSGPLAAVVGDRVEFRQGLFSSEGGLLLALRWIAGGVSGAGEVLAAYPAAHPRLGVAESLIALGQLPLVFAIVGIVLAVSRWGSTHVRFDKASNEWGAHVVAAWLVSGMVAALASTWAGRLQYAALAEDMALVMLLLPYGAALLVGGFGFYYASRAEAKPSGKVREGLEPHEST